MDSEKQYNSQTSQGYPKSSQVTDSKYSLDSQGLRCGKANVVDLLSSAGEDSLKIQVKAVAAGESLQSSAHDVPAPSTRVVGDIHSAGPESKPENGGNSESGPRAAHLVMRRDASGSEPHVRLVERVGSGHEGPARHTISSMRVRNDGQPPTINHSEIGSARG